MRSDERNRTRSEPSERDERARLRRAEEERSRMERLFGWARLEWVMEWIRERRGDESPIDDIVPPRGREGPGPSAPAPPKEIEPRIEGAL
jgi:hypothetical protein